MTDHQLGSGPIQEELRAQMLAIARAIDEHLNPKKPKRIGFVVLMFHFGDHVGGRMNYISNAHREDVITALREQLAYFEGSPEISGQA